MTSYDYKNGTRYDRLHGSIMPSLFNVKTMLLSANMYRRAQIDTVLKLKNLYSDDKVDKTDNFMNNERNYAEVPPLKSVHFFSS